jgi:hypothetical protein
LDKDKVINALELNDEADKPNYLTFHVNDSTLTLVRETKDKKIVIQDVNYINGTTSFSNIFFRAKHVLSHKNITFIVGEKVNISYPFAFIKKASDTKIRFITPKNKIEESFFSSLENRAEFVNDKQFLNNGPILKYKGFYNGEKLIFTNDDEKKGTTHILTIYPSGDIVNQNIPVRDKGELKRLNSFIKDSLLFTFKMYKNESFLDIYKLNSLVKLKTFRYTKSDFGPHHKVVLRGEDITKSFVPKKFYKDFTPQVIGSMYLPTLTISVNKTTSNDYVIRIGHLDKNSYDNKTTSNFWWNNDAYGLNHDLSSGSFSVNMAYTQMVFQAFADAKNTGNYFELNLNQSLDMTDTAVTYEYYDIDNDVYDDRMKYIMDLKKHFYIIQKDYVRFINFDKSLKAYNIYNLTKLKN